MTETSASIMRYLARTFFNNRCEVTHEPFQEKGFTIHHVEEIDNDVLRTQFPKGEKGRYEYLKALKPLIEQEFERIKNTDEKPRFALIKNGIHTKLDHKRNGVTRLKMENRVRFCDLALRTIHLKKKKSKGKK